MSSWWPRMLRPRGAEVLLVTTAGALLAACHVLLEIDEIEFGSGAGGSPTGPPHGGAGGAGGNGTAGETSLGGQGGQGGAPCVLSPWGSPTELAQLNTTVGDWDPSISTSSLTLYWATSRSGGQGESDIWFATRPSVSAAFGTAQNLTAANSTDGDLDPEISPEDLTLYFASDRAGGAGSVDIWFATRATPSAAFDAPQNLAELNTTAEDRDPALSRDGLTLYFMSDRTGGAGLDDIWVARRPDLQSPFGTAVNVTEVNSSYHDANPALSPDGLTLYFSSERPDGTTEDIWFATRSDGQSPFGTPQALTDINDADADTDPCLSADGLTMYFASDRAPGAGSGDLWTSTRTCD